MRKPFTLPELVLVAVMLALSGALIRPWCAGLAVRARQAGCLDNLKNIGSGLGAYIHDSGGAIPPADISSSGPSWTQLLMGPDEKGKFQSKTGFVKGRYIAISMLKCPAVRGRVAMNGRSLWWGRFPHYAIAWDLFPRNHQLNIRQAKHPEKTIFAVDSAQVFNGMNGMYRWTHDCAFGEDPWWGNPMARHRDGSVNTLSLGGNAGNFKLEDVRHPNTVFPFAGKAAEEYVTF